jgi:type I restriction enzyme S subunit
MPSYAAYISASELEVRSIAAEFYSPHFIESARLLQRAPGKATTLGKLVVAPINNSIRNVTHVLGVNAATVPMFRPADMDGWWVSELTAPKLPEDFEADHAKSRVHSGDIVLAIAGTIAKVGRVPPGVLRAAINGSCARIRLQGSVATYGLAFLNSRYGRAGLERLGVGSVQKHLNLVDLPSVPFLLPDRRIQDYIGAKVELAERCRAVSSRSWVAATALLGAALGAPLTPETFEVKSASNVSGSGYEVSSIRPVVALVSPVRLVGAIAAQFFTPRRAKAILFIEQSGLGAKRLSVLADRFAKRVSAEEVQARGLSYVGLAQVDSSTGFVSTASEDEQPSSSSAIFGARDILFSKLRPYLNKVAICPEYLEESAGSPELVTYRAKPGVDPYYVFFVLKSPLVLNQVIDITSGSTHPRVDPGLIDDVLVPMAEEAVQKRIGELARTALELMRRATLLVEEAKADVEALIEGTLDVQAILAGTLKASTADDIPELAEDGI